MAAVIKEKLLPDEIYAAAKTAASSFRTALPNKRILVKYFSFYLVVYTCGFMLASLGYSFEILKSDSSDFWRAAIATLSVLSGFMISTMAFTGKAESAKSLTLEGLKEFSRKSNHLLVSQLLTLFNHILGIVIILLIQLVQNSNPLFIRVIVCAAIGHIFLSLFRSLLVPLQIIELHRFSHAALLEDKRKEEDEKAADL